MDNIGKTRSEFLKKNERAFSDRYVSTILKSISIKLPNILDIGCSLYKYSFPKTYVMFWVMFLYFKEYNIYEGVFLFLL